MLLKWKLYWPLLSGVKGFVKFWCAAVQVCLYVAVWGDDNIVGINTAANKYLIKHDFSVRPFSCSSLDCANIKYIQFVAQITESLDCETWCFVFVFTLHEFITQTDYIRN